MCDSAVFVRRYVNLSLYCSKTCDGHPIVCGKKRKRKEKHAEECSKNTSKKKGIVQCVNVVIKYTVSVSTEIQVLILDSFCKKVVSVHP